VKTCLVLADRIEPTADLLVATMRRRGVPCLRWNLDGFPINSSLTYRITGDHLEGQITSDGRTLDLDQIGSVWCRTVRAKGFPPGLDAADRKFAETEAERVLTALYTLIEARWVNHPLCHLRANAKPAQLAVARKLGFDIPETLITNDPEEVRAFIARTDGPVIYKALSQALDSEPGTTLFTSVLTDEARETLDLIQVTPGIFQALVPKAYELRLTIVGERIFAARIDSQSRADSRIDWRRLPFEADAAVTLPGDIEAKIHAFMQHFGLNYGAIDIIVTPDGRYVFLEINPAGQYMWIESKLGLPITDVLVDLLSEPCG
jgi:glutathione synthase/RimK-type ligase-like ATP-grasp enzyme